jgi:plasmid stabilization system protein ParE
MALKIRWTPKAVTWLDTQLTYWEDNELPSAAAKFSKDLHKKLNRLSNYPETGRATSSFKKIRFVIVDKRYDLFYRVNVDNIVLLSFFDTRQDPKNRPY